MPRRADPPVSRRIEIDQPSLERVVFRFVRVDNQNNAALIEDFRSDAARGKTPRGRSAALPGHIDGMSAFRTLDLARERWRDIASLARRTLPAGPVRVGEHIAEVALTAGAGFACEDLEHPSGHLTIWGDPAALARAVLDILPAEL